MSLNQNRPYRFASKKERFHSNHDGFNDQYRHLENVERKKSVLPMNSKHAEAQMQSHQKDIANKLTNIFRKTDLNLRVRHDSRIKNI